MLGNMSAMWDIKRKHNHCFEEDKHPNKGYRDVNRVLKQNEI